MYYESGTGGRCCICTGQTLCVHCCIHQQVKWRHGYQRESLTSNQNSYATPSIDVYYLKHNPSKFHSNRIWNDGEEEEEEKEEEDDDDDDDDDVAVE